MESAVPRFSCLEDVLEDIYVRFLIYLPEEERKAFERLGFQLEQAFWFYEDFYREPNAEHLPRLSLPQFGTGIMKQFPRLAEPFGKNTAALFEKFSTYKSSIPTCGAILVNEAVTKCLMIKSWNSRARWSFPKGKVAKDESFEQCAAREVHEEIGYDISSYLQSQKCPLLTVNYHGNAANLFVVFGVPEATPFAPISRKEISDICWHSLDDVAQNLDSPFYGGLKPLFARLFKLVRKHRSATSLGEAGAEEEETPVKVNPFKLFAGETEQPVKVSPLKLLDSASPARTEKANPFKIANELSEYPSNSQVAGSPSKVSSSGPPSPSKNVASNPSNTEGKLDEELVLAKLREFIHDFPPPFPNTSSVNPSPK